MLLGENFSETAKGDGSENELMLGLLGLSRILAWKWLINSFERYQSRGFLAQLAELLLRAPEIGGLKPSLGNFSL